MKIIEVVGLAGVGKSTLTNELITNLPESYGQYRLRKKRQFPRIIKSLRYSFPLLIRSAFKENIGNPVRTLLQFEASLYDLEDLKNTEEGVLILDQGPLFSYASLLTYELDIEGFEWVKEHFYQNILKYGCFLDGIIYLNAPIDALINRVEKRSTVHQLKKLDVDKKYRFYQEYDTKYTSLIKRLGAKNSVSVCNIDTFEHDEHDVQALSRKFISSL